MFYFETTVNNIVLKNGEKKLKIKKKGFLIGRNRINELVASIKRERYVKKFNFITTMTTRRRILVEIFSKPTVVAVSMSRQGNITKLFRVINNSLSV